MGQNKPFIITALIAIVASVIINQALLNLKGQSLKSSASNQKDGGTISANIQNMAERYYQECGANDNGKGCNEAWMTLEAAIYADRNAYNQNLRSPAPGSGCGGYLAAAQAAEAAGNHVLAAMYWRMYAVCYGPISL